ncbi:MAG: alpha/beta fold hydrolase [Snowella sp.]|nr:alpha/beta fold hydrolase [Snowella sp.]
MKITDKTLDTGKLEWFYREGVPETPNHKPPVLLLHGLPSQSYTWLPILNQLAENGFQAIAPDWIGSGLSDKPEKRDFAYTPQAYLEALTDLIKALNLERLSIVVQGYLASVGIQYALQNSDRIEKLVILNTPLTPTAKLPWPMTQWTLPFVGDMVTQDPLLIDRTLEGGSGFVVSDEKLDVYRRPYLKTSAVGRALMMTTKNLKLAKTMPEIESGLKSWSKPTLVIWGMLDPWLAAEPVEQLVKTNSQLELIKLPEAKHYPQEHWPDEIAEVLIPFLRRQVV